MARKIFSKALLLPLRLPVAIQHPNLARLARVDPLLQQPQQLWVLVHEGNMAHVRIQRQMTWSFRIPLLSMTPRP